MRAVRMMFRELVREIQGTVKLIRVPTEKKDELDGIALSMSVQRDIAKSFNYIVSSCWHAQYQKRALAYSRQKHHKKRCEDKEIPIPEYEAAVELFLSKVNLSNKRMKIVRGTDQESVSHPDHNNIRRCS
jgi:hypothetical protein